MDLSWLEVFRAVADTGSFTAAAQHLGYTQSAVSRQIAALESNLGSALFERLPRGARLTEAGRYFAEHAAAMVERLHAARRELADLRSLSGGRLRIGAFPTAGAQLVPRALAVFTTEHPLVAVSYRDGLTGELADAVRRGDLDVAVVNAYPDRMDTLEPTPLTHLWDEPILVALPSGHRLAGRRGVTLNELADESWIAASTDPSRTLSGAFSPRDPGFTVEYTVADWLAKLGFVAAGLGVTLVPALAAAGLRSDVSLAWLVGEYPVRRLYAAVGDPTPAAVAFVSYLEQSLITVGEKLPARP